MRSGQGKGTSTTKKGRIIIVSGDGKTPSEKLSDPSEQISTSPSQAEQSDTASDGKTPSEKQSDPPEQVSTLETSNSLSKAQTFNSTAPLELVQPSLEQLQANRVSLIHADSPRDDPHNCSQEEGQGDKEE